jgi:hypothetical protein
MRGIAELPARLDVLWLPLDGTVLAMRGHGKFHRPGA